MKLARYRQAAMIAAILAVTANGVWAQESGGESKPTTPGCINCFAPILKCFKEGNCCIIRCSKGGECCIECCKCEDKCTDCTDNKCASCNGKTVSTKSEIGGCPILSQLAKGTAIIMVMPSSMPLPVGCCLEASGILPHPPIPAGPQVFLPPMMPPMPPIPPTPSMGIGAPMMPTFYGQAAVCPCPDGNTVWAAGQPAVVPCSTVSSSSVAKVCIIARPSSDQLEMSVAGENCACFKKMTIKIGDKDITLSRFDDRVRVRGEGLKATANCVHKDCKDRLILEGNVVLHYKKDGNTSHLIANRVELDPSNGDMAIHKTAHYDRDE